MSDKSKNNISSSGAAKSLLPENVVAILQRGMTEGYKDGYLDLIAKYDYYFILFWPFVVNWNTNENRKIDDSMIPELCEWIIKLEGKVKILKWVSVIAFVIVIVHIEDK